MQPDILQLRQAVTLRHSVRSFDANPLTDTDRTALETYAAEALTFFGNPKARIAIIDSTGETSAPSTYGFIAGCRTYMVLISSDSTRENRCRAAAAMELCVLEATRRGLATCWVGGTFRRSSFADTCHISASEEILAIVPCGIAAKPRLRDRLMSAVARSHSRKDPSLLFFDRDASIPLSAESPLFAPLEYVRLAPSSTNSQPWRIIALDDRTFDLCSATDNRYTDLDIGIAMAHIVVAFAPATVTFSRSEARYPRLLTFCRYLIG